MVLMIHFSCGTVPLSDVSSDTNVLRSIIPNLTSIKFLINTVILSFFKSFFVSLVFKVIFVSGVGIPLYPETFYFITQWSCSASESLREMPDSNPEPLPQKSSVLAMPPHLLISVCVLCQDIRRYFIIPYSAQYVLNNLQ